MDVCSPAPAAAAREIQTSNRLSSSYSQRGAPGKDPRTKSKKSKGKSSGSGMFKFHEYKVRKHSSSYWRRFLDQQILCLVKQAMRFLILHLLKRITFLKIYRGPDGSHQVLTFKKRRRVCDLKTIYEEVNPSQVTFVVWIAKMLAISHSLSSGLNEICFGHSLQYSICQIWGF